MQRRSNSGVLSLTTCSLTLLLGVLVFGGIIAVFLISGRGTPESSEDALAQLTIIPAPTITPTVPVPLGTPNLSVRYVSPEGFSVGAYVKVENTQGAGLKIRPKPGTGSDVTFIADEGDLFKVIDGPDDRNGYIWWRLQGLNDKALEGWGASAFLTLVAPASDLPETDEDKND